MAQTQADRGGSSATTEVSRLAGLSSSTAVKGPCRACSTSNITLSGEQTIDGVACVADDRVLVTGQTDQTLNGIYYVATGTWSRAPDFSRNDDVRNGTLVWVGGTANSGLYTVTTADPITFDTSNLTFSNVDSLIAGALLATNNLSDVSDALTALDNLSGNATTLVSASPLNLDSVTDGEWIDVSGNTSFSAVTLGAGKTRFCRFTGTPTITVGASLIGNNAGANVTLAAGDLVVFRGYASGVVRFWHFPLTGPLLASDIGVTVQAYDADTAKLDTEGQVLTGGTNVTSKDLGTISSGTVTPDPSDRPLQHYTNNGAHTLAPDGTNKGSFLLDITNGASAGAITTSGWTKVVGAFTTTNGHKFRCSCSIGNAGSLLSIQPLQ